MTVPVWAWCSNTRMEDDGVAYAPTRLPGHARYGRRPPRGPRVPGSIRDRLTTAAALVKGIGEAEEAEAERLADAGDSPAAEAARGRAEVAYDAAAAVTAVLAPRGYRHLEEKRAGNTPLTLGMTVQLKQALEAAGAELDVVFSGLAEEALQKVIDGWVPPNPPKVRQGEGRDRAVMNIRVDSGLLTQVREMLPALSKRAGYDVKVSTLMLSYICDQVGVERPNTAGSDLRTRLPKRVLEHFEGQAGKLGLSLDEIAVEGVTALLDGEWVLPRNHLKPRPVRAQRSGSGPLPESERAWFQVRLSPELLADLRARCSELSDAYGYLVHPGSVVRAVLTDRLGEPAE